MARRGARAPGPSKWVAHLLDWGYAYNAGCSPPTVPKPVTESLVIHWRPTVEYHLHRLDLLKTVEENGPLEQFLVTPERIGVRTDSAQLTMEKDEVSLYPRGSLLDPQSLDLLRLAFKCASPPEYHYFVAYQYLIPVIDETYDAARKSAISNLSLGFLDATDFALTVDGSGAGAAWQCQFGVISEDEVESRLRRRIGVMTERVGRLPDFIALPDSVAPVSFFAELLWQVPTNPGSVASVDDIAERVQQFRDEADHIVGQIHAQVTAQTYTAREVQA